jgi:hypothetical protein
LNTNKVKTLIKDKDIEILKKFQHNLEEMEEKILNKIDLNEQKNQ